MSPDIVFKRSCTKTEVETIKGDVASTESSREVCCCNVGDKRDES